MAVAPPTVVVVIAGHQWHAPFEEEHKKYTDETVTVDETLERYRHIARHTLKHQHWHALFGEL